jgi:hypothetical protein
VLLTGGVVSGRDFETFRRELQGSEANPGVRLGPRDIGHETETLTNVPDDAKCPENRG